jgi:hypothetical protein
LEIYCFGRPGHRLLGVMILVMSCIIAHEAGMSTPELSSTTIVIRLARLNDLWKCANLYVLIRAYRESANKSLAGLHKTRHSRAI